mmetsp:Transcript_12980/g.39946  ORF Transcript_12980/g.39946 Transcript_12980/m.39946 type:complete len:163 (+) Transcript_12980:149-637(+)
MNAVRNEIGGVRNEIGAVRGELKDEMKALRGEMVQRMTKLEQILEGTYNTANKAITGVAVRYMGLRCVKLLTRVGQCFLTGNLTGADDEVVIVPLIPCQTNRPALFRCIKHHAPRGALQNTDFFVLLSSGNIVRSNEADSQDPTGWIDPSDLKSELTVSRTT